MSLILRIWNSFYHSVAEPQPKIRTLTTEATEEHGGTRRKPKSKNAGSKRPKIFAA
jgi:hypothetical protein